MDLLTKYRRRQRSWASVKHRNSINFFFFLFFRRIANASSAATQTLVVMLRKTLERWDLPSLHRRRSLLQSAYITGPILKPEANSWLNCSKKLKKSASGYAFIGYSWYGRRTRHGVVAFSWPLKTKKLRSCFLATRADNRSLVLKRCFSLLHFCLAAFEMDAGKKNSSSPRLDTLGKSARIGSMMREKSAMFC